MTKFKQDIELFPGDDLDLVFTVKDEDAAIVDITAATVLTWVIVHSTGTKTLTLGSGVTITDGPNGIATAAITSAISALFGKGEAKHQLIMTLNSKKKTIADGRATIYESII